MPKRKTRAQRRKHGPAGELPKAQHQPRAAREATEHAAARTPPGGTFPSGFTAVAARYGIYAIVALYLLLNLPLLLQKPHTLLGLRVFSLDERRICAQAAYLVREKSFTTLGPAEFTCNPYPYGQLYNILLAGPLLILQTLTRLTQPMLVNWAVIVLWLSGVAVLVATYKTAARLYSPFYGLLAALFLVFNSEFLRWSVEIHPDLLQLAFMAAGFYFTVRLHEHAPSAPRRSLLDVTVAAACAGAAMATKLYGVFLLPVILVAYNRPFAQGLGRATWRRFLLHNLQWGGLTATVFAGTFFLLSPCYLVHPELIFGRLSTIAASSSSAKAIHATGGSSTALANLLASNYLLADRLTGRGMYAIALLGTLVGLGRLLRRYAEELRTARILPDLFNLIFLSYLLVFGYGLIGGRLLTGYQRYALPALPVLYLSGLRLVHMAFHTTRVPRRLAVTAVVGGLLLGQVHMVAAFRSEYASRYFQTARGTFKVYSWVQRHVPRGARIYTEYYIFMPQHRYEITRDYMVSSLARMAASDYVITKTLRNDVFTDPERWKLYTRTRPEVIPAKKIYQLLARGALPGFKKVAELSAGERFGRTDTVIVYKNLHPPPR